MKTRKILAWLLTFSLVLSLFACNKAEGITCPECDEECDEDAAFCPACGEKLNQTVECKCGHENKAGSKFCSACGASLKDGNDKLDNNTNGDKENNDPENNDPENNDPENNGQGDGEKEETPPDPAESIWLKVRERGGTEYEIFDFHIEYYYNYDGQLIGEYNCGEDNKVDSKWEYAYDEHGSITLKSWREYNSSGNVVSSSDTRYYYTYDENGNLLSVQDSSGWKVEYVYDEKGNLVASKKFNGYGELKGDIDYKYDEKGNLIASTEFNGRGELDRRTKYEYENGKIKKEYSYDGESDVVDYSNEYKYNEQGWKTEVIRAYYDENGEVTSSGIFGKYEYDEHGNIIRETYDWDYCWKEYQYMTLAEYRAQGLHEVKPDTNPGDSGSGSGSGSSGQGVKCEHCKGGIYECHGCDGVGQVFYTYGVYGEKLYKTCIVCHGEGFLECSYCGGDGIFGN